MNMCSLRSQQHFESNHFCFIRVILIDNSDLDPKKVVRLETHALLSISGA